MSAFGNIQSNMNISYPPIHITDLPPAFKLLSVEVTRSLVYLLVPCELLYFAIYFKLKGFSRLHRYLSLASLVAFWLAPVISPLQCNPVRSLQNLAVGTGTLKVLDLFARRNAFPTYVVGRRPQDWLLALILLTELRYESFSPNHIRVPKHQENFNEPLQLGVHILAFSLLQFLPQVFPTVLASEVLLAIYIIWTSMQLLLRYKSSPPLFGPIYMIDSVGGFWSETWHNVYSSPCDSLAYKPLRYGLPKYGVPVPVARAVGVLGAFTLMGVFHVYALAPVLKTAGLIRIWLFFFLNGVASVVEASIWGHKKHWAKVVIAWAFGISISSWTAQKARIPNGLSKIPWWEVCDAPQY